jgi:anti-sigma regulatory factor (Ser/Thr protein kinase)
LRQIKNSDDLTHFLTEIVPLLHLEPAHVEPIKYIISELVRNVLEHSYSKEGAVVCAQFHKKGNKIRIGIVDTGIGIMESIKSLHPVVDELHAVRLALTPGVTGTTRKPGGSEQNAGAGLFFIKTIAFFNRDPFVMYTGSTMYKLQKRVLSASHNVVLKADPFADRHSTETDLPHWQGVVVGIDIDLKNAHRFAEVLRIVQDFYFQTVKEKKKAKYKRLKRPRFID